MKRVTGVQGDGAVVHGCWQHFATTRLWDIRPVLRHLSGFACPLPGALAGLGRFVSVVLWLYWGKFVNVSKVPASRKGN
jgi:hypothetical protein